LNRLPHVDMRHLASFGYRCSRCVRWVYFAAGAAVSISPALLGQQASGRQLREGQDQEARIFREINHFVVTGDTSTVLFGVTSPDGASWTVIEKPLMLHDADTLAVAMWDPNTISARG
jgi:hypothetical protein